MKRPAARAASSRQRKRPRAGAVDGLETGWSGAAAEDGAVSGLPWLTGSLPGAQDRAANSDGLWLELCRADLCPARSPRSRTAGQSAEPFDEAPPEQQPLRVRPLGQKQVPLPGAQEDRRDPPGLKFRRFRVCRLGGPPAPPRPHAARTQSSPTLRPGHAALRFLRSQPQVCLIFF